MSLTQIVKPIIVLAILAINYLVITYGFLVFVGLSLSILLAVFLAIYFKFKVKNVKPKRTQNKLMENRVNGHLHNVACEQADPDSACVCMCKGRYHAIYSRYIKA